MNKHKKTGLFLGFFGSILMLFSSAANVYAATGSAGAASTTASSSPYQFIDGAHIQGDLSGVFSSAGTVTFADPQPSDNTGNNYRARNFRPQSKDLCDPGDVKGQNGVPGNAPYGIDLTSNDLTASTIPAYIKIALKVNGSCDKSNVYMQTITVDNPDALAATDYTWGSGDNANNIVSLAGTGGRIFRPAQNDSSPLYVTKISDTCGTDGAILLDSPGSNSGTYFDLSQTGDNNVSKYPDLANTDSAQAGSFKNCHVTGSQPVTIAGSAPTDGGSGGGSGSTGGGSGSEGSCESHSLGWAFTWAVCPVLAAANSLTTELEKIFESQLSFSVGQLGSGQAQVKQTWAMVKYLISGALVIIMLIMVFSQALGEGILDAYTVRKMLPRLIAAAILIQLSWPLFSYVIDVFNYLGQGLQQLMYLPFGSASNMDLYHLLYHAHLTTTVLGVMDFSLIVLGAVLAAAFLFTMLGVALTAIIALLFAVITLVFRKILLIALLIFSPLALLAWILPNTEKYWKLWWDNFIKALMMYPIAVAIIATGRIFAYIVGTQKNTLLLNLIFIMVGYFAPLFILPKTFKWGGSLMTAAGDRIMKAGSKVSERPKKYFDSRQEEYNHQKPLSAAQRLAKWRELDREGKKDLRSRAFRLSSALRGDKFRSGEWDPAYNLAPPLMGRAEMKRVQQEKLGKFRAAVPNAEKEEYENEVKALDEEMRHLGDGDRRKRFNEILANKGGKYSENEMLAAARYAIQDRDFPAVEAWQNRMMLSNHLPVVNRMKQYMAGDLALLAPNLLKGDLDVAVHPTTGDLVPSGVHAGMGRALDNPNQLGQQHGRTAESILTETLGPDRHGSGKNLETAQKWLLTMAATLQSPTARDQINPGQLEVLRKLADSRPHEGITFGQRVETAELQGLNPDGTDSKGRVVMPTSITREGRDALLENPEAQRALATIRQHVSSVNTLNPMSAVPAEYGGQVASGVPGAVVQPTGQATQAQAAAAVAGGGQAAGEPITVQISHEQVANAVAQGVQQGMEGLLGNVRPGTGATGGLGEELRDIRDTEHERLREEQAARQAEETRAEEEDRDNPGGGGGEH